jgi:hypothetical protein
MVAQKGGEAASRILRMTTTSRASINECACLHRVFAVLSRASAVWRATINLLPARCVYAETVLIFTPLQRTHRPKDHHLIRGNTSRLRMHGEEGSMPARAANDAGNMRRSRTNQPKSVPFRSESDRRGLDVILESDPQATHASATPLQLPVRQPLGDRCIALWRSTLTAPT